MRSQKPACPNMNHGKLSPPIRYCPNCGEKFKSANVRSCSETQHSERRKQGNSFCVDCGKALKT